jgi:hypothetical protein
MRGTVAAAGAAGIVLVLFATVAAAVPRLLTPFDGAKVRTSFPVFRWTLPPEELAREIFVARLPRTNLDGSFPARNVVASDTLATDDERWVPTRPLWAGTYWWLVTSTVDSDTDLGTRYSAVSGFTIPISLEVLRITGPKRRVVTVRWRGNVPRVAITLRLLSRGRLVWMTVGRPTAPAPGRAVATRFTVPARYAGSLDGATFSVGISARVAPGR